MHTVAEHPILDAALTYARRGWRVLPVRPNDKAPTLHDWPSEATTDADAIRQWFENSPRLNLGIACGRGLVVVDIDVKNGQDGEAAIAAWEAQHGALPPTYEVLTPSGGRHLYFQAGDLNGIKNRGNLFGEGSGVDIKADGGQVLAPPSTIGGKPYVCGRDGQVARIPPALLNAIITHPPQDAPQAPRTAPQAPAAYVGGCAKEDVAASHTKFALGIMRDECAKVRNAQPGTRNDTLNAAAFSLGQLIRTTDNRCPGGGLNTLDYNLVYAQLEGAALAAGLGKEETAGTTKSGLGKGQLQPRDLSHITVKAKAATPTAQPTATPKADPDPLAAAHHNDAGNAQCFVALHGHKLRYDRRRKRWLVFRPRLWWDGDCEHDLRRMANQTYLARYKAAWNIEDKDARAALARFALSCGNVARENACLISAQALDPCTDSGDGWDADPMLLGVANGVIDLRTGQLREGRPEDKITRHLPHEYDPDAKAPRWEAFLREVFADPEIINFLHRACGYSLTGDMSEQAFFICYGQGANGKSKFLGALRHVLGPYAVNSGFDTFDAKAKGKRGVNNDVAALAGARLVTAFESAPNTRLDEDRIKAITGGDAMTGSFLYQEPFTFQPECKLWLGTNHRPEVGDDSYGFWRRVRMIPFERTFEEAEADKHLGEKLQAEAPGILAWMARGCRAWQAQGLAPVAQIADATKAWEDFADGLADFLTDRCTVAPQAATPVAKLYAAYNEWADANGLKGRERMNSTAFGRRMGKRFAKARTRIAGKLQRVYEGIGLAAQPEV